MNQQEYEREKGRNQAAYEALRERIRREHAGQYVAMAEGRLIATAATFDEARAAIARLKPMPGYYLVFPADKEPAFELVYDF